VFGLIENAQGATGSLVLSPGTTLVLFSDGVTEAEDPGERQFGLPALLGAAAHVKTHEPDVIVGTIVAAITEHAGSAEQADDIAILAVTFNGGRPGE
jgi:sigma-B regulation protein RsbU (phosphoserine phosphatase)